MNTEKPTEKPEFPPNIGERIQAELNAFPASHYALIGKIVASWSYLERFIDLAIWKLMSPDLMPQIDVKSAMCVTGQIPNMARRFDALLALIKLRGLDEVIIKQVNKFFEKANGVSLKRNRVVHDNWGINEETGKPVRTKFSVQKELIFEEIPADMKELEEIQSEIIDLITKFQPILDVMGADISKKRPKIWNNVFEVIGKIAKGQAVMVSQKPK